MVKELPFVAETEELLGYVRNIASSRALLPRNNRERAYDGAIAVCAIREALRRHAGYLTETYTPKGGYGFKRGRI